jgi:hypothetical protein
MQQAKIATMLTEMDLQEIMREGLKPHGMGSFRGDYKPPAKFFTDHCTPTNGLVVYGGCFSNHFQ